MAICYPRRVWENFPAVFYPKEETLDFSDKTKLGTELLDFTLNANKDKLIGKYCFVNFSLSCKISKALLKMFSFCHEAESSKKSA